MIRGFFYLRIMITIEPTKDFQILAELNAEVQDWHHQHYPDVFKKFDANKVVPFFEEQLKDNGTHAYIALKDNQICGYILCFERERKENPFQYSEKFLLIDQICVLAKFRRLGIARSLLQTAEKLAINSGCQSMQLNHWTANDVASSLFKNFGFLPFNLQLKKHLND